jgi:DNA-binding transcriptional regulator YhcF (GntR family)
MAGKVKIDRELFHSWLWHTRGPKDVISMTQSEMAEKLKAAPETPGRLLKELAAAGKVVKFRGSFKVVDPEQTKPL